MDGFPGGPGPPPCPGSWGPRWKSLGRALAVVLRPCWDPAGCSPLWQQKQNGGFVLHESLAVGGSPPAWAGSAGTVEPCFLEYKVCSFPFRPGPPAGSTSFPRSPAPGPLPAPHPSQAPQQASRSGAKKRPARVQLPQVFIKVLVKLTPKTASAKSQLVLQRQLRDHSPQPRPQGPALGGGWALPNSPCFS